MIITSLPRGSRPFISHSRFSAQFNVPTPGVYDFGVAANRGVHVLPLRSKSLYYVEIMTIGADMTPEVFQSALDPLNILQLQFFTKKNSAPVPDNPVPVSQLFRDRPAGWYFVTDSRAQDTLIVDLTGRLNQPMALVGVPSVSLSLSLSVFSTSDPRWVSRFSSLASNERP